MESNRQQPPRLAVPGPDKLLRSHTASASSISGVSSSSVTSGASTENGSYSRRQTPLPSPSPSLSPSRNRGSGGYFDSQFNNLSIPPPKAHGSRRHRDGEGRSGNKKEKRPEWLTSSSSITQSILRKTGTTEVSNSTFTDGVDMQHASAAARARVPIDAHDGMWIAGQGLMEDVERVAGQVSYEPQAESEHGEGEVEGHFFGRAHVIALEDLRQRQVELAGDMARGEGVLDIVSQQGKIWELSDSEISGFTSIKSATSGKDKGTTASAGNTSDAKEANRSGNLFSEEHFKKVHSSVDLAMEKLDAVVASMKVLEAESRELWHDVGV